MRMPALFTRTQATVSVHDSQILRRKRGEFRVALASPVKYPALAGTAIRSRQALDLKQGREAARVTPARTSFCSHASWYSASQRAGGKTESRRIALPAPGEPAMARLPGRYAVS
jgi:hypothetical protein